MNTRARNRLIGVAVLIGVIAVAGFITLQGSGTDISGVAAYLENAEPGQRVKVTGMVVDGSWDGRANPMRFVVRDQEDESKTLPVKYSGVVPSGFGKDTQATLTGALGEDGVFEATDMLTQCPSRYKKQTAPLTVTELNAKAGEIQGTTVRITGFVKELPEGGMVLTSEATGGDSLTATVAGDLPAGVGVGVEVVLTGQLDPEGVFKSTTVQLAKE